MTSPQVRRAVDAYLTCWSEFKPEAQLEVLADDFKYYDKTITDAAFDSKDTLHVVLNSFFACMSNPKLTEVSTNGNDTFAATEWEMTFNYTRPSPLIPVPCQGQRLRAIGCALHFIDGVSGKVKESRHYCKVIV